MLYSPEYDKYSEDPEFKPASRHAKDLFDEVQIKAITLNWLSARADLQKFGKIF